MSDENKRYWGEITQGVNEVISYTVKFGKWGTAVSSPTNYLYDSLDNDVSSTKLTGSASMSDTDVITSSVTGLIEGETYRFLQRATVDGQTMEAWGYVIGEN